LIRRRNFSGAIYFEKINGSNIINMITTTKKLIIHQNLGII